MFQDISEAAVLSLMGMGKKFLTLMTPLPTPISLRKTNLDQSTLPVIVLQKGCTSGALHLLYLKEGAVASLNDLL